MLSFRLLATANAWQRIKTEKNSKNGDRFPLRMTDSIEGYFMVLLQLDP